MSQPEQHVSITSLFGMRTRKGLVHIKIGTFDQQWESSEARRVALMLLEAAEAADGDSFVAYWLTEKLGVTDLSQLAAVLRDFRELRAREPSVLAKSFAEIMGDEMEPRQ